MPIRVLDAETVGRIAAGEVIERPASIVKELVENSIDAGSTSVTVEIREGGTELIRITDNGCGIPAHDMRLAFTNHATSKLASGDMLTDIRTLGFRGEALASVAAVSKVEMRTKTRESETGAYIKIEAGEVKDMGEAGCPTGTTLSVKDLFYNVPVRKAFLKKASYEAGAVYDVVAKMVLGNPSVAIRLVSNGKTMCHSFGDGKLKSAALSILGRETTAAMREIDESEGAFRIKGLIGIGDLAKQNRSMQYFFINGRAVRCYLLSAALETVTKERVGIGMHPICALHVQIPAASVDVNVHPNKLEVRFRDEAAFRITAETLLSKCFSEDRMLNVQQLIEQKNAVESAKEETRQEQAHKGVLDMTAEEKLARAQQQNAKPDVEMRFSEMRMPVSMEVVRADSGSGENHTEQSVLREPAAQSKALPTFKEMLRDVAAESFPKPYSKEQNSNVSVSDIKKSIPPVVSISQERFETKPDVVLPTDIKQITVCPDEHSYRIIGAALNTYLILEVDSALVLIDQHAAHERILFEKYKKQLASKTASQRLLVPMIIKVTPKEIAMLEDNMSIIEEAGYEVSQFGDREVRIDAVPFILGSTNYKELLGEMLDDLSELKNAQEEKKLHAIVTLSCRKAIKGGDALTESEIKALVDEMLASNAPPTCPHGRPVARTITKSELEKMFWRT